MYIKKFFGSVKVAMLAIFAVLLLLQSGTHPDMAQAAAFKTVIVVDTTAALADTFNYSKHTCTFISGAFFFPAGDGKCTLRRAIVEAGARPDTDRPILIKFNIPTGDPNYDSTLQVWEVQIDEAYVWELKRRYITDSGGYVRIDGATQPGGRTTGPKIMVNTNSGNSELFGRSLEVRTPNNHIRGLGFIGGGQIILYEGGNLVEDNWMGLTADGSGMSLASTATAQAKRSMARGGIIMPNEASDNNTIRNNIIIGAFERAIRITSGGDDNIIDGNIIGLNASGGLPPPFDTGVDCTRNTAYNAGLWYGGRGIQVTGSNNTVTNNRLAGLHVVMDTNETPPITLDISGVGHTVTGNIIGRDVAGNNVGVCGQGMLLQGTDHLVELNTIVHSRNGFDVNDDGTDFDNTIMTQSFTTGTNKWITVRKNTVLDAGAATHPDHVYRFAAPGVPVELRKFNPAKVTAINGTTVTGTQGDDEILPGQTISAACPNCQIYLYADDLDSRIEALEFLGEATANGAGNWTATLSRTLTTNEGLRTQSMANGNGVIHTYGAGTTSKLSDDLYRPAVPPASVAISGATAGSTGTPYTFNVTVNPANVTTPLHYVISGNATPLDTSRNTRQTSFDLTWATPGTKVFTVTVDNGGTPVSDSHTIVISEATVDPTGMTLSGPAVGDINVPYTFNVTVNPAGVTLPLHYVISGNATPLDTSRNARQTSFDLTWATPGTKTFTISADNGGTPVAKTHTIVVSDPNAAPASFFIYLPLVVK